MALINNNNGYYNRGNYTDYYTRTSTSTSLNPYWYNQNYYGGSTVDSIMSSVLEAKLSKKRTFEDKLQSEINDWLKEFK